MNSGIIAKIKFKQTFMNLQFNQGVQSRMVLVVSFFVFLKLVVFTLLLLCTMLTLFNLP